MTSVDGAGRRRHAAAADNGELGDRCGEPIGAGSARYHDRVALPDGRHVCQECARALRGHVEPVMKQGDVPITMPNTNLPNTH